MCPRSARRDPAWPELTEPDSTFFAVQHVRETFSGSHTVSWQDPLALMGAVGTNSAAVLP